MFITRVDDSIFDFVFLSIRVFNKSKNSSNRVRQQKNLNATQFRENDIQIRDRDRDDRDDLNNEFAFFFFFQIFFRLFLILSFVYLFLFSIFHVIRFTTTLISLKLLYDANFKKNKCFEIVFELTTNKSFLFL